MRPSALWCAGAKLTGPLLAVVVASGCGLWLALGPALADNDAGNNGPSYRTRPGLISNPGVVEIATGVVVDCVSYSGVVWCLGDNHEGALGSGDTRTSSRSLVPVTGGHVFNSIASGYGATTTCGIRQDSLAYCWGMNQDGVLGIGTTDQVINHTPVAVSGGHAFATIKTGGRFACALTGAGAAWCWGAALGGGAVLGAGADSGQLVPGPVSGSLTFTTLSAGNLHMCGIAAGAAYCWGDDYYGQLGVGGSTTCAFDQPCRRVPTAVSGGMTWTRIAAGQGHTCGIVQSGAAYCWGVGTISGALGAGKDTSTNTPLLVAGGMSWTDIAVGRDHTCAITVDGFAYCWGNNSYGQLGIGTQIVGSNTPLPVVPSLFFTAIEAAGEHTCAIGLAGKVYCWGIILE